MVVARIQSLQQTGGVNYPQPFNRRRDPRGDRAWGQGGPSVAVDKTDVKFEILHILQEPVKELGTYEATANLHKEVIKSFNFEVVAE